MIDVPGIFRKETEGEESLQSIILATKRYADDWSPRRDYRE